MKAFEWMQEHRQSLAFATLLAINTAEHIAQFTRSDGPGKKAHALELLKSNLDSSLLPEFARKHMNTWLGVAIDGAIEEVNTVFGKEWAGRPQAEQIEAITRHLDPEAIASAREKIADLTRRPESLLREFTGL